MLYVVHADKLTRQDQVELVGGEAKCRRYVITHQSKSGTPSLKRVPPMATYSCRVRVVYVRNDPFIFQEIKVTPLDAHVPWQMKCPDAGWREAEGCWFCSTVHARVLSSLRTWQGVGSPEVCDMVYDPERGPSFVAVDHTLAGYGMYI